MIQILAVYRRRQGTDGAYPYEILFRIKPRFNYELPSVLVLAEDQNLSREFELALTRSVRASRVVQPQTHVALTFKVGERVLMRRGKLITGPKLLAHMRSGPFLIRTEEYPRYTLGTEIGMKSRKPMHACRLRRYVTWDYRPERGSVCWFRNHALESFAKH